MKLRRKTRKQKKIHKKRWKGGDPSKNKATVVSAYYIIPSKASNDIYMERIKNFMSMNMQTIIFVDEESHKILSALYPESDTRKYSILPIDSFETSKFDWKHDESIDTEKSIGHNEKLYKIWNEKPFFMKKALEINPYKSEYYMWVDIGCFRNASLLKYYTGFPLVSKFNPEKIQFLEINPFTENEKKNTNKINSRFEPVDRIGGTMIASPSKLINKLATLQMGMLKTFDINKIFKGMDQDVYAFIVLQNPDLFEIIKPEKIVHGTDRWFYFHEYFSKT